MNFNPALLAALAAASNGGPNEGDAAIAEALKSVIQYGGSTGLGRSGLDFIPEDVEAQAHIATWTDQQLTFFRRVPHTKADSLRHEFQRYRSHDPQGMHRAITVAEGGIGQSSAYTGERVVIHLKEWQRLNVVTKAQSMIPTIGVMGSTSALETNRSGILISFKAQMGLLSWWMTDSDPNCPDGWVEQFKTYHADPVLYPDTPYNMPPHYWRDPRVLNTYGQLVPGQSAKPGPLTYDAVTSGIETVNDHGQGRMNNLWTDVSMHAALQREFRQGTGTGSGPEYVEVTSKAAAGITIGNPVKGINLGGIVCAPLVDPFLNPTKYHWNEFTETPSAGAPATPAAAPSGVAAAGGNKSLFQADDASASIKYKVQPVNADGQGTASAASAAINVAAGDKVTLTWDSAADTVVYRILRNTKQNLVQFYEIGRVANTGGELTFIDYNWLIPGARWAIGFEMSAGLSDDSASMYPANAGVNTICMADLQGKGIQREPIPQVASTIAERLITWSAPQLNLPGKMVVYPNLLPAERS
jgi:hypothetical protein